MPISTEVQIIGGERLLGWLAGAPVKLEASLYGATLAASRVVADAVREASPVFTGALRGSIGTKVTKTIDGATGEVYSTSDYARFVEFGTREHGRAQRMFARGVTQTRPEVLGLYRLGVSRVTESFGQR